MLNSSLVELLLGVYSKSGGAQEIDSSLPDSWTAITPNDLLIGDSRTGSLKSNYTETGPAILAKIENKVSQAWVEACQDTLFRRDPRWVKKSKNIEVGDIVWLVQDAKLCRRLKWGIVKSVHPDHDGVVLDAIVQYALLKPGPEPYVTTRMDHSKPSWWLSRTWP
jgi:hypothetical protein